MCFSLKIEIQFSSHLPSLIAAASIATAVRGLQLRNNQSFEAFLIALSDTIGIDSVSALSLSLSLSLSHSLSLSLSLSQKN